MAQIYVRVNGPRHAFAYEDLTIDNTAGGKGATVATAFARATLGSDGRNSVDQGAEEAVFTIEGDQIRYTMDGTAPTASLGHLLNAGDVLTVVGRDIIRKLRMIRVTTNATVRSTYFRD